MNKQKLLKILKNAAAIVVMLALFIIIYYQNRDRGFVKLMKNEETESVEVNGNLSRAFEGFTNGDVFAIEDKVVFVTSNTYGFIDAEGKGTYTSIAVSSPLLHGEGEFVIYYGEDAKEAFVCRKDKAYYKISCDNKILKAKVNRNGYAVVATGKEGYNSEIMVYNKQGEAVFKWDIGTGELIDFDLNCDNNKLALSLALAGDNILIGELELIDITQAAIENEVQFESEVYYNVDFNRDGTFIAIGSTRISYFNRDGSLKWEKNYDGKSLIKADVSDNGMPVLAYSAAGSSVKGNATEIELLNRLGKSTASTIIDAAADAVCVNNEQIAVACGKKAVILDSSLKTVREVNADTGIKKMAFFGDGKHLFVIGSSGGMIVG